MTPIPPPDEGGSYILDPTTGERRLVERGGAPAVEPAPTAPAMATGDVETDTEPKKRKG